MRLRTRSNFGWEILCVMVENAKNRKQDESHSYLVTQEHRFHSLATPPQDPTR